MLGVTVYNLVPLATSLPGSYSMTCYWIICSQIGLRHFQLQASVFVVFSSIRLLMTDNCFGAPSEYKTGPFMATPVCWS
jgi:hypothetical protein